MGVLFDKLSFMKRLEDGGGFTRPQAEALSEAFHQAMMETVATKQDVAALGVDVSKEFDGVRKEFGEVRKEFGEVRKEIDGVRREVEGVRGEVEGVRKELHHEIALVRSDMKTGLAENRVWTVGVGATVLAVLASIKYFG